MRQPLLITSLVFFALAAVCGIAESVLFGGRIDQNNVVQESLFLPLTFIFAAGGIVFCALYFVRRLFGK